MLKKLKRQYDVFPLQLKASIWFLACSFLQRGISSITMPIFTRLLSTAEYGVYSVFNSWMGIVTIFVSLNLSSGVCGQGLVKFGEKRDVFVSSLQGLTLTLTAIWTFFYLLFHEFWNRIFSLTTIQMLAMLVMIWTSAVFNFWSAEQRVKLFYKKLIAITILVSIAKPVLGIFLVVHSQDKVTARIWGLALVELIVYTGLFIAHMKRGRTFFNIGFWKYAIMFNLPLVPHYLSQTLLNGADRIMIDKIIGESEAGIYSVAYSVSMLMTLFNMSMLQTLGPWMYQKIKDGHAYDIPKVTYIALVLVGVLNIFLIAFAPEVVKIFAPSSYYDAIWVIPPVAMSVYFTFCYELFARFEFYYEKTKFVMLASITAAVLNLVLNYIFIPIFGYYAAGYTTLICYIAFAFAHYLFMKKVCKMYIGDVVIYKSKTVLTITGIFLLIGFSFLPVYNLWYLRYAMVMALLTMIFLNRRKFLNAVYTLGLLRQDE